MHTASEENYIKTIYHLNGSKTRVSTNLIAENMGAKASSVTDMMKKLARKKMVDYQPYRGVLLSLEGVEKAKQIIRKHRLWEVFLVDKLDFPWHEVHEVAEQLEHIQSKKLIDELDDFLGNPVADPHGDPIPDRNGHFTKIQKLPLSELERNRAARFVAVADSDSEFLQYLDRNKLQLGQVFTVVDREPFDDSCQVRINGKTAYVSGIVAAKLFMQII